MTKSNTIKVEKLLNSVRLLLPLLLLRCLIGDTKGESEKSGSVIDVHIICIHFQCFSFYYLLYTLYIKTKIHYFIAKRQNDKHTISKWNLDAKQRGTHAIKTERKIKQYTIIINESNRVL